MNIAFVLNKLNDKERYLNIIEFYTHYIDTDDRLYPKLSYNLASAYYRNNDFKKALKYSNIGIKSCRENRDFNGLNLLYYIKGLSEYKLDKIGYLKSLNTSLTLCLSFGQEGLRDKIIYNCKQYLEIELQ